MKEKKLQFFWQISLGCLLLGIFVIMLRYMNIIPESRTITPLVQWISVSL